MSIVEPFVAPPATLPVTVITADYSSAHKGWNHGRLWPLSLAVAPSQSTRTTKATTDIPVLSQMVWPYGLRSPVLISHAMTSERTEVATVPAGTLWDGTYDDSKSSISSTELDYASTVSTNSTVHASTTHVPCLSSLHHLLNLVPFHHLNPNATIPRRSPFNSGTTEASRVCGFDLNENWQGAWEHYDNQKVNGLTFPRMIRSSAFTQKLDIEGCDPLALPVAALLDSTNKPTITGFGNWPMGERYISSLRIPTGDIAAVVFARSCSLSWRIEGSTSTGLSGQGSTGWEDTGQNLKYQTCGTSFHRPRFPTRNHSPPKPIGRITRTTRRRPFRCIHSTSHGSTKFLFSNHTHPTRLHGFRSSCTTSSFWSSLPSYHSTSFQQLAHRQPTNGPCRSYFCKVAHRPPVSDAQRNVLVSNIAKADTWWSNQLADAVETGQKVAVMMGILPVCQLQKNFNATNLIKVLTVAIRVTNWPAPLLRRKLKHKVLQYPSILSSFSPCDDPGSVHFLNWTSDSGVNIRTSMFGPQSLFLFVVLTIAAWNLPSYRSGNPDSTILLPANFSTLEKGFWKNLPWTMTSHTLASRQTQIHATGGQSHLAWPLTGSKTILNFGRSSTP